MKILTLTTLTLLGSLLMACDSATDDKSITSKAKVAVDNSEVLATIDGVAIRQSQLDTVLSDMFGEYKASQMDTESQRRALDSMLASYALSQRALDNLPANKINAIEEKTRRYRENLLINAYMQTKMDASAVSSEKIKTYYQKNLEKFGQRNVKQYQLLTTRNELLEEARDKYLSAVASAKSIKTLPEMKKYLEQQGFEMQLQAGVLDNDLLDQRLRQFINSQVMQVRSEVTFIDRKPYIVAVTSEKVLPAKPLEEVKEVVRKTLVLNELKGVIKKYSAEALADSTIIYGNQQKAASK